MEDREIANTLRAMQIAEKQAEDIELKLSRLESNLDALLAQLEDTLLSSNVSGDSGMSLVTLTKSLNQSTVGIPTIDLSLALNPSSKAQLLSQLCSTLTDVGFFYLKNSGIDPLLMEKMREVTPKFFDLPLEEKRKVDMINTPRFLGYTALGAETTANEIDQREQFDFSNDVSFEFREGVDPEFRRLKGASQWPEETVLPGFKDSCAAYASALSSMSLSFLELVAEAIGLDKEYLKDTFIEEDQMHKLKLVKYAEATSDMQGVGPHKDSSGMFTFLYQLTDQTCLQVMSRDGKWLDVPSVPGTLVVNIAQGFEAITGGRCPATPHRLMSPLSGMGVRYSIPFFQGMRLSLTPDEVRSKAGQLEHRFDALRLQSPKDFGGNPESIYTDFLEGVEAGQCLGDRHLRNRILSHPDVGQKWYPELYKKYTNESK